MKNQSGGNGVKIGATAIVWGFSTGMLAICIPLVSITESGIILPLTVIMGAMFSTLAIWLGNNQRTENKTDN